MIRKLDILKKGTDQVSVVLSNNNKKSVRLSAICIAIIFDDNEITYNHYCC